MIELFITTHNPYKAGHKWLPAADLIIIPLVFKEVQGGPYLE
jgi:hypothetical protein